MNRYSGLLIAPRRVEVRYVLDMAEIPTFQERRLMDIDGDGSVSHREGRAWGGRKAAELLASVDLRVDGRKVPLRMVDHFLAMRPGQAGLPVLRLEATFSGSVGPSGSVWYRDGNYPDRIGWREITVRSAPEVAISGSNLPSSSTSRELRTYPEGLLSSPLEVSEVTFSYRRGSRGQRRHAGVEDQRTPWSAGASGSLASLVDRAGTLPILAGSLLFAFALGAFHAFGPGHGKTIMAAYLLGHDAPLRSVVAVGVAVSAMHTGSVLVLSLVTVFAARLGPPDRVYPWLGVASGAVVMALGASLLVRRSRARWRGEPPWHHHADGEHHRLPLGARPISRRGLGALAVSGGILPSPAALVLLLGAIALNRLGQGLALIGAFSLGLASTLVVVGVLAARARGIVSGRLGGRAGLLPLLSAGAIVVAGVALTARSAIQIL